MSVKRKLNDKRLDKKCQALKDLESGLSNKEDAKNIMYLKTPFQRGLKTKRILLHRNNLRVKGKRRRLQTIRSRSVKMVFI